jgi:hypothetical protein
MLACVATTSDPKSPTLFPTRLESNLKSNLKSSSSGLPGLHSQCNDISNHPRLKLVLSLSHPAAPKLIYRVRKHVQPEPHPDANVSSR